jgi:hypothetical protein
MTTVHLYLRQQIETDVTNAHNITRAMSALQAAVQTAGHPFKGSCEITVDDPLIPGQFLPIAEPRADA